MQNKAALHWSSANWCFRPKPDLGEMSRCCIVASPKQPFDALRSIFAGQRAALRDAVAVRLLRQ